MEYRVLPGFEPGTSAWPGRGPPELRTRPVPSVTTSVESATFGDRIKMSNPSVNLRNF